MSFLRSITEDGLSSAFFLVDFLMACPLVAGRFVAFLVIFLLVVPDPLVLEVVERRALTIAVSFGELIYLKKSAEMN